MNFASILAFEHARTKRCYGVALVFNINIMCNSWWNTKFSFSSLKPSTTKISSARRVYIIVLESSFSCVCGVWCINARSHHHPHRLPLPLFPLLIAVFEILMMTRAHTTRPFACIVATVLPNATLILHLFAFILEFVVFLRLLSSSSSWCCSFSDLLLYILFLHRVRVCRPFFFKSALFGRLH